MTNRSELEALAHAAYAIRNSNDPAAVVKHFHPDCKFQINGSKHLGAFSQLVTGHSQLYQALEALMSTWDLAEMKTERLYVDGNTVIAVRKGSARHKPSNKKIETEWVDIFSVNNGLIVNFSEYVDTHLIAHTMDGSI